MIRIGHSLSIATLLVGLNVHSENIPIQSNPLNKSRQIIVVTTGDWNVIDGSCIFLHIWEGPGKGTAGCTAMGSLSMEEVLRWLDGEKRPVLVQLPRAEFERLRGILGLQH